MNNEKSLLKEFGNSYAVTLCNALRAFAINKMLAVFLPPATFACVGQFLNFMTIGQATSSLALQNGWASLTAQNKGDALIGIWRGGLRITTFASLFTFIFAVIFCFVAPMQTLFPGLPTRLVQAAILFALPGIFSTNIITITASVMNGLRKTYKWSLINIVSSFWQVIWVAFFLYTGKLSVLSIIATQSIVASLFAIQIASRAGFSVKKIWKSALDTRAPWVSYAIMGLVPMIMSPIVLTFVRLNVDVNFGHDAAGIWQSVTKISDFLFMFMSAILTVIILPKVSIKMRKSEFFQMFNPIFLRIMCISFFAIVALYFCRSLVVQILMSKAYIGAIDYMPIQLIGDFFRTGGYTIALVLIARAETKKFLIAEIFSQIFLAASTFIFIKFMDFNAPMIAYAIENFAYFIIMLFILRGLKWESK